MKKTTPTLYLLLISLCWQAQATNFQSIKSIKQSVHHYIVSNIPWKSDYKINLSQIDNRLKLLQCAKPLSVSSHYGSIKPGRNAFAVKCTGQKPWKIYTTAVIQKYLDVVVLAEPVRRGEIIKKRMLRLKREDISTLRTGYVTSIASVIHKQATRNLKTGYIINKTNFTEPKLIKRGERVYIKTGISNLHISVAGIALMDGVEGQNIRVKNIKSKRIVQATVIQQGQVMVTF